MSYKVIIDEIDYNYIIGNISKLTKELIDAYKKSLFDLGGISSEYVDLVTTKNGVDKQLYEGAATSNLVTVHFIKIENGEAVQCTSTVDVSTTVNMNNIDRSDFANNCCRKLYKLYNGDFSSELFIEEVKLLKRQFEGHVRNIYELIDEIPLFEYIDFLQAKHRDDYYSRDYDEILSGDSDTWKEEILQLIVEKCKSLYDNNRIEIKQNKE